MKTNHNQANLNLWIKPILQNTATWSFVLTLGAIGVTGCGKSVNIGSDQPNIATSSKSPDPQSPTSQAMACGAGQTLHWRFMQPDQPPTQAVDLLFVADTSDSLIDERPKIASQVPAFISQLKPNTDYRIAVMLAHGGASSYSGSLYAAAGSSKVLDSKTMSIQKIQQSLENTLKNVKPDVDEADGEMGIYSFIKSLDSAHLPTIQKQGFYRDGAALSVIFITDENDICYDPKAHGYTTFPDYVPSYQNSEDVAYKKYCTSFLNGYSDLNSLVDSKLQSTWNTKPISLGGIIYQNGQNIPRENEQAIGHGILELVESAPNHVLIDLASTDYSSGLAKLGNIVSTQLEILTQFFLNGENTIQENTLAVTVDNVPVEAKYNAETHMVSLTTSQAGHAQSVIDVTACKQ